MKKRYISPTTKVFTNSFHQSLLQASVTVKDLIPQKPTWFGTDEI